MRKSSFRKLSFLVVSLILLAALVSGCTAAVKSPAETQAPAADADMGAVYHSITPEEAKALLDGQEDVILLDVREQSEFDAGHIPGAVLLPSGYVSTRAAEVLPDKDQTILVYCRSGNRSRTAANTLVNLGYTQVYDLGGIMNWPYEVVTE